VRGCVAYLGDDRLWRYETPSTGGLRVTARASDPAGGTRDMHDGRFLDDITVGPPVAVRDNGQVVYWLPSAAGVEKLDAALGEQVLSKGPFPGLGDGVPAGLFVFTDDTLVYAAPGGFFHLLGGHAGEPSLASPVATGSTVESVNAGPAELVEVRWRAADGTRGWSTVQAGAPALGALPDGVALQLAGTPAMLTHRIEWGDPNSEIQIQFAPGGFDATRYDTGQHIRIALPAGFLLRAPIRVKDQLILVGDTDILELSLSTLARELYTPKR
jgi:hypothetical protein